MAAQSGLLGQQLRQSFMFKQETHCQGNESFFIQASLRQSRFSFLSSKVKQPKHTNIQIFLNLNCRLFWLSQVPPLSCHQISNFKSCVCMYRYDYLTYWRIYKWQHYIFQQLKLLFSCLTFLQKILQKKLKIFEFERAVGTQPPLILC